MRVLLVIMALLICVGSYAEEKNKQIENSIATKAAIMNAPLQESLTGSYLDKAVNCKIYSIASLAVGGAFAGIASSIEFNTDNQKNQVIGIGCGICGISAVAFAIADIIYSKKAAKAAKMEIRPSHEGLGMNIAF